MESQPNRKIEPINAKEIIWQLLRALEFMHQVRLRLIRLIFSAGYIIYRILYTGILYAAYTYNGTKRHVTGLWLKILNESFSVFDDDDCLAPYDSP